MTSSSELLLTPLAALYREFTSPFSLADLNSPSTSTLMPAKLINVDPPIAEIGHNRCPIIDNFALPEVSINYLPRAIVTRTGSVIYKDHHLIAETVEGSYSDNYLTDINGTAFYNPKEIQDSDEVVICINRNSVWNYSLFLSEMALLALICAMNSAVEDLRTPIFFQTFMSEQTIRARQDLLAHFGITEQRLFTPAAPLVRYRGVVLVKVNERYKNFRVSQIMPYVSAKLKFELATPSPSDTKRLYVSRQSSSSRSVKNFDELVTSVLQPFNIRAVELDNMPVAQQINMFTKADLVIAEHGAGLVNAMFMRPGSILVEVVPGPLVGRWMYRMIAHHSKLNYSFGSFETPDSWVWNKDPVTVPCEIYRHLLERVG